MKSLLSFSSGFFTDNNNKNYFLDVQIVYKGKVYKKIYHKSAIYRTQAQFVNLDVNLTIKILYKF